MRTILVDDEELNLKAFEMETEEIREIQIVGKFQGPAGALNYAENHPVDMAVLDIEMPGLNGLKLGERLKQLCPNIILIYVTGYREYAYDAFQLDASSYILKPYDKTDIVKAIAKARRLAGRAEKKEVFIRTFGRFEVFVEGQAMQFKSSKAKELLGLLVDRNGGIVTTEEILTYLWENKANSDSNRSLCRKVLQRLRTNLEEAGIGDIVLYHKHGRSIDKNKVRCDFYQYLNKEPQGLEAFRGEYMSNYSWGEETLGRLIRQREDML